MSEDINIGEIKDNEWINARELKAPPRKPAPPKIDAEVSKVVGFHVKVNDPRVIKKVMEWRRNNPNESFINNNYLADPQKVKELKEALR